MNFDGKVAVVTGAAKGIGYSCSEMLAQRGAKVALADINEAGVAEAAEKINGGGGIAKGYSVDVSSVKSIENLVQSVLADFGRIDILINNAGILHTTPIEDITEEEWDRIVSINLKSVFFMTQKVLPSMKENRYGKILNLSSLAGRNGGFANGLGYSATKAGIIGLTRGFAARLAQFSINVNAIAPGSTDTGILDTLSEEKMKDLVAKIPLGRFGKPEEIAEAAVFLCSDEAAFITGAVLDVNGGMYFG